MLALYSLLGIMLLCAVSFLALPFIRQKKLFSKTFLSLLIFVFIFSFGAYQISGHQFALMQWLTVGKQRYALLEQFNQLGGVDGAIQKIEARLKQNANDARGWVILSKLYSARNDSEKATFALQKAHELERSTLKSPAIPSENNTPT